MINNIDTPIFKYRLVVYKNDKKVRSIIFPEDLFEYAKNEYEDEVKEHKNEHGYKITLKDIDTSKIISEYDTTSEIS